MARLRDARTSEVVFEGTPLECVVAAQQLGGAEVAPQLDRGTDDWEPDGELVFDDVGLGFDPDEVMKAAQENVAGLERAATETKGEESKRLARAVADAKAQLRPEAKKVGVAKRALEAARQRSDDAAAAGG